MIDLILQMLSLGDMIGVSKEIDIAKGMYKEPGSVKEGIERHKRKIKWQ